MSSIVSASAASAAVLEKYKSVVGSNRTHALARWIIGIHGPPGHGKSWFAASASAQWPGLLPAAPPVKLEDMIWLSADSGATAGLAESGIEVDDVNLRDLIAQFDGDMPKAMSAMLEIVRAMGSRERVVVLDTASQLDLSWNSYYLDERRQPRTKSGEFDTQKFYNLIRSAWLNLHNKLHEVCPRLIYTFHTKSVVEPSDKDTSQAAENQRLTLKAGSLPGDIELTIAMTGQAREMMVREATVLFNVKAFPDPKNPGVMLRKAYSAVKDGSAAKNRWQRSVPPICDANLGLILNEVRKNLGDAA